MVATLFFSSITDVRFKVQDATYLITLTTILALSFQAFLHLRYFPDFYDALIAAPTRDGFQASTLLIYVGIGTFMTDIGAYLVGTFFGKFKMNVRVSKNKTWEGFWGGVIMSAFTSFSFAVMIEILGTPILPFLKLQYWYLLVIFSLMIPLVATLGDFTFSIIKREFGVKNFSSILGEHGGILDRVDSFSMTCLASSLLITIIYDWMFALHNIIS
jgi:phosphatidate cytidylyltransferase